MYYAQFRVPAFLGMAGFVLMLPAGLARASSVFDGATETFAQTEGSPPAIPWSASLAIDGNTNGEYTGVANGWAIADTTTPDPTNPQSAFFRLGTAFDLTSTEGIQIDMYQLFDLLGGLEHHTLGAFRLSVTGDALPGLPGVLALGTAQGASWTALVPPSITVTSNPSLPPPPPGYVISPSGDILINNPGLDMATYTITARPGISHITGIRLDVLAAASLPTNGPGFQPTNGNFVLNEITAAVVPVPLPAAAGVGFSTLGAFGAVAVVRKRLRRKGRIA